MLLFLATGHESEVVRDGSPLERFERGDEFRECWLSLHYSPDLHPVEVMRAIGWRCPRPLSGTSSDQFIYPTVGGWSLMYPLGGVFVDLKESGELSMAWHIFVAVNPGWTPEGFFYDSSFGVKHILETFPCLKTGLDRYPIKSLPIPAPAPAEMAIL